MGGDVGEQTWHVRRGYTGLIGMIETGPGGYVGRWTLTAYVVGWDADGAVTRIKQKPVNRR
jgi:hypothetical protein